jgi:hypothetical protein
MLVDFCGTDQQYHPLVDLFKTLHYQHHAVGRSYKGIYSQAIRFKSILHGVIGAILANLMLLLIISSYREHFFRPVLSTKQA